MNKLVIIENGYYTNLNPKFFKDAIYDIDYRTKGYNFREIVDTLKNHLKYSKSKTVYQKELHLERQPMHLGLPRQWRWVKQRGL